MDNHNNFFQGLKVIPIVKPWPPLTNAEFQIRIFSLESLEAKKLKLARIRGLPTSGFNYPEKEKSNSNAAEVSSDLVTSSPLLIASLGCPDPLSCKKSDLDKFKFYEIFFNDSTKLNPCLKTTLALSISICPKMKFLKSKKLFESNHRVKP